MRAGAPGHNGHVSADSAIRCAASRATLKNSSPSPSLRSSYQAAASSSSASASASSASLTTGLQSVGDALLRFVPGDKCGRAVGNSLYATVELLDPSLLSTGFRIAVETEQEVLGERGALVDRWTRAPVPESQPKMGPRSGPSICTKDENPNHRWGFQWRRRELNLRQKRPRVARFGWKTGHLCRRHSVRRPTGFRVVPSRSAESGHVLGHGRMRTGDWKVALSIAA